MSNNDEGPINYCLRKNELIKNYLLSNLNEAQTDEEKICLIFIARRKLEKDFIENKNSFPPNIHSEINNFLIKINFKSLYKSLINVTIKEFLNYFSFYEDCLLEYKIFYEFMCLTLKGIKSINEQYYNDPIHKDKNERLKFIWKIFCKIRSEFVKTDNLFKYDYQFSAVLVSEIFDLLVNDNNREKSFYYGAFKEILSKHSFVSLTEKFSKKVKNEEKIKEKVKFLLKNDKNFEILENEEEIDYMDILDSFLLENFEEKNNKSSTDLLFPINESSIKISLDGFISDLKRYESLDINLLLTRYLKLATNTTYAQIHQIFIEQYPQNNYSSNKDNLNFDNISFYSIQKKLFLKFLFLLISPQTKANSQYIFEKITKEFIGKSIFPSKISSFFFNLQIISYYTFITLQYIENKSTLILLTYSLLDSLFQLPSFSLQTSHRITSFLLRLRSTIPFNIYIIIKKYFNDLLSFVLFNSQSIIFTISDFNNLVAKDFFVYCFDIINKIASRMCYNIDRRERIFDVLVRLVNEDNEIVFTNKYVDAVIIAIFAIDSIEGDLFAQEIIEREIEKIIVRYGEEKKKTFVPDIYDLLLNDPKKKLTINILKIIWERIKNYEKKKPEKYTFLPYKYDFKSLILTSSKDYNTIYKHSPGKSGTNKEEPMLSKKRIRVLTPTIAEKTMIVSPFSTKINYSRKADTAKAVSAFKNLNFQFQSNN